MEPEFWLDRWRESRIGFHQDAPTPLLLKHWDAVGVAPGSRVFVPLCGKSLDMVWLASRGYRVLGCELSPLAVSQFFEEQGLAPRVDEEPDGVHYVAGPIEIVQGNVFQLHAKAIGSCRAVYDRAALIALPPKMRERYVTEVWAKLPQSALALLITLEYPKHEKQGPPFSVSEIEVRRLFGEGWSATELSRLDILGDQPGFRAEGVTALETTAFKLMRR